MKKGFTLSEVLITLAIIGVVAVVALASLINNAKDRQYSAARQKVFYTIGQAGRTLAVNGYLTQESNAQNFVENVLSKQIKIVKTCANNNLKACGIMTDTNGIKRIDGASMTMPKSISQLDSNIASRASLTLGSVDKNSYGFVMANGYSVNLFYNPSCFANTKTTDNFYCQDMVCINAIYDVNGLKKPNQVGKDIGFVTIMYPNEESVALAPEAAESNTSSAVFADTSQACETQNKDYRVPTRDEMIAMYYNSNLLNLAHNYYWTSASIDSSRGWMLITNYGKLGPDWKNRPRYVRCVKK